MKPGKLLRHTVSALGLLMTATTANGGNVTSEGLVLAGTKPTRLLWADIERGSLTLRDSTGRTFAEGKDFVIDYPAGTIARTNGSPIPDFTTNILYGKDPFDHSQHPGYGNLPFTVWADYRSPKVTPLTTPTDQSSKLTKTAAKLKSGGPFKIIAFGDSITYGGEASKVELQFPHRYAAHLRERFPKAEITVENGATGGDTTAQGLARLEQKVLTRSPDLVLVGFGMNDHNNANVGGVEPAQFQKNLVSIVRQIKDRTGADVILFSAFPPNPKWVHGSHRMDRYAAATKAAAAETDSAYADVYTLWMKVLERKDPESLLGNNINHPNDFGHWLYHLALAAVQF